MNNQGYVVIEVLQQLYGLPFNDLTKGYLKSLRPSEIRVTNGFETSDAILWRVTVVIEEKSKADKNGMIYKVNIIKKIKQEVMIDIPNDCQHGYDASNKLRELKKWDI